MLILLGTPIISLIVALVGVFVITLNYESTFLKRVVTVFGCYALLGAIELLVYITIIIDPDILTIPLEPRAIAAISIGILSYLMALGFRRFKNIKRRNLGFPMLWISILVICSAISLVLLFTFSSQMPHLAVVAIVVGIFGINFLIFYLYDTLSAVYEDKLASALHTQEKEYYFAQCQLMQESAEQVKTIRHDMKFHLATARDFTANNKASEATDYLGSLLDDINTGEVYSNTGNIAFDSIINYKLKTAAEDNIKVEIDVLVPKNLNIDTVDVVIILGNLLENALEAVTKVDDKVIKLNIEASKGNLFIKVDNAFDGEVKYAKGKNGAEKVIATRKDGDNHGYGLKNIRKAVEKYNGHLDITHDDGVFSVGVLVFAED
ncbi:MAG: GHKL domain-containing protein [Defluviitaleaceae bacterium]|nr:GHKL domain-containing protein [Defluviitaleaceae bacterium]